MFRTMLKSKIHRATVTQADLHYVGSVTIDADLMDAADLLEGEQVTIVDIDNGARLVTYAITGERGSGVIGINGAAAHLVHPGDLVILIAYGTMEDAEARDISAPGGVRRRRQQADRPRARSGARAGRRSRADVAAVMRVLLAIDVRNTHTVVGLISGSGDHAKVVQHWRIRTESEVTADELALTIDGLIGDDSERLTGAAGLSTVPSVLHEVRDDARAVLAVGAARADRARGAHRNSASGRQSQRGRRRPDRQLPCGISQVPSPRPSSWTSVRRSVSTWCRPRASSSAVRSLPACRCRPTRRRPGRRRCGASS